MKYCDNFGEMENHSMKIIRKNSNDLVDLLNKMANRKPTTLPTAKFHCHIECVTVSG